MPQRGWWRRLFPELAVAAVHRDRASAWGWLNAERDNLRAVVELAARLEDDLAACRLVVALWSVYEPGKLFDDLIATTEAALQAARRLALPAVESLLLSQLTFPYHQRGQADEAYGIAVSALEAARRCGDPELQATAIEGWAWPAMPKAAPGKQSSASQESGAGRECRRLAPDRDREVSLGQGGAAERSRGSVDRG
ncbi:hypothetical protein L3Q65_24225 [Amycolatopsis sp. FU40]|uniref:hypothetical protein n=1 Tax=Amycolatopsis sp. FU40 TaxID=2914159 RepID=UPI001F3D0093|nr:hypothetical protein [Amycolatopsis sp. FU40]UKD51038.1 hypothetical protein L3Q65_24225 [Amycolatopsis sp. FU40]